MPSRHVITTCSDARYEGFLVDHWLASLRDNVTLTGVDVIVIDYGLTDRCRARLQASGVSCHPGRRDGHPTNIRYRELAEILSRRSYDQVLVNYLLYKDGFERLETGFNFVLTTATSPYSIRAGVFYDASGEVIPVVHNAGMNHVVRRIRRFGYGRGRNVRKRVTPAVLKVAGTSLRWCRTLRATRA